MRIVGIIAEYNPFHNGHAWHIQETRRLTGCDYVVVCMDGHFTQRGDAAILSKWDRAHAALMCGADAVFELPALYAVRPAEVFARGGVAVLGGLGVDVLSFGCEIADQSLLCDLAELTENEPESVSEGVQRGLSEGMTFARAWGDAVSGHLGIAPEDMNHPNLILAIEYIRAIHAQGFAMEILSIPRKGGYHDATLGEYASASAIRAAFSRGDTDAALACVPEPARYIPDRLHAMDDMLMYRLRDMTLEDMAALPDMSEGLEQRLYKLCRTTSTRDDLLVALKCKRYTHARLNRMLTHAVTGMTRQLADAHSLPTYARLLGMRSDAKPLMKALSDRAKIPIISDPTRLRDDPVFKLECRASDLWALLHDDPALRLPGREFTERFIMV